MFTLTAYNDLLISYYGPFSMRIISTIGKHFTENIYASEIAKMKLYRVFIELSQNVARYSAEKHVLVDSSIIGAGSVYIQNNSLYFKCTTVNKILSEHQNALVKNCHEINSSTKEDLKKRKEKLRKESTIYDTGAHIGLIAVCLYSENQFEFDVINKPENNANYFSITATINKT